jgi:hypothetical protein
MQTVPQQRNNDTKAFQTFNVKYLLSHFCAFEFKSVIIDNYKSFEIIEVAAL